MDLGRIDGQVDPPEHFRARPMDVNVFYNQ
jgi:hypothetical protein